MLRALQVGGMILLFEVFKVAENGEAIALETEQTFEATMDRVIGASTR